MFRPVCLLALALLVVLAGCGGSGDDGGEGGGGQTTQTKNKRPEQPALCGELTRTTTGKVDPASQAAELSGLVASRKQDGVLWAIEDSGNTASLVALRADGTFLGRFEVPGAQNVDWEDIAAAGDDLYIADIGDNLEQRDRVVVYRVPEPDASTAGGATAAPTPLELRYADGPHDAESLLVDPRTRELIVITKDLFGAGRMYVAPAEGGELAATRTTIGGNGPPTGAGLSPDGRTVAVRSYTRIYAWSRRSGESLAKALRKRACSSPTLLDEGQGEAIAVLRGGRSVLTVTEGGNAPIYRYEAR